VIRLDGFKQELLITINKWKKTALEKFPMRTRISLHLIMWIFLFSVYYSTNNRILQPNTTLTLITSFKDLLLVCIIFYSICYYAVPQLLKWRIWVFALVLVLCLVMWVVVTHEYAMFVLNTFNIKGTRGYFYYKSLVVGNLMSSFSIQQLYFFSLDIIYMVMTPIVIKGIITLARISYKMIVLERNKLSLERDNLALEINFLKSQINPHFLFNNMNNIYSMIVRNDSRAQELVMNLSDVMRYTLYESNVSKIEIKKEIAFIIDYISLEQVRYGDNIVINCDYQYDSEESSISPLLMFPFIENAFKYGARDSVENAFVDIKIDIKDDVLNFSVKNTYDKAEGVKADDGIGGIGIQNVTKRLQLLYPGNHALNITDNDNLFSVAMTLMLN
jgi:two-component system LytT family sensor kinase